MVIYLEKCNNRLVLGRVYNSEETINTKGLIVFYGDYIHIQNIAWLKCFFVPVSAYIVFMVSVYIDNKK